MKIKALLPLLAVLFTLFSCGQEESLGEPNLEVSTSRIEFPMEGGSQTITLCSTLDWGLKDYDDDVKSWLSIDPASGKASNKDVTITIKAAQNSEANREVTITFYANVLQKQSVTITQPGASGDGKSLTIKEFLDKKDTEHEYKVTGKVGNISNSQAYYGVYLKDETGELCCAFPTNWQEKLPEISTGCTMTIIGTYSYFESKNQDQMENGEILEVIPVEESSVQSLTVKEFLDKADSYSTYRLSGTVSGSVNTTYCSFDLQDATGTVKVYTVNNASEWGKTVKKGGIVTLRGAYTLYNGTPEVVDAWIEEFEGGDQIVIVTGENLISTGGFENWVGDKPEGWSFTNGNATLAQSSDARTGSLSVKVSGDASSNKRLMSQEIFLKPGLYEFTVYAKGNGKLRLGYGKLTNHAIANTSKDYVYINDPVDAGGDKWEKISVQFTLTEATGISLIVMNSSKGGGEAIFIDDASIATNEGGIEEGGSDTIVPEAAYPKIDLSNFKEGKYCIANYNAGKFYVMKNEIVSSYYVAAVDTDVTKKETAIAAESLYTIKAVDGGYTIQDSKGTYLACSINGTHYNLVIEQSAAYVWTLKANADGSVSATGANSDGKYICYDANHQDYSMNTVTSGYPTFYLVEAK